MFSPFIFYDILGVLVVVPDSIESKRSYTIFLLLPNVNKKRIIARGASRKMLDLRVTKAPQPITVGHGSIQSTQDFPSALLIVTIMPKIN